MTNRPALAPFQRNRLLWTEGLTILLLILLPFLFFWQVITPNPADQLGIVTGDFTEQYFPLRAFSAGEWVNGRVPLWNPALFGGQPALADPQSGALYPPHVIEALLLGWAGFGFPIWALELQVIMHFSLAAVGAYLLGRHWAGPISERPQVARLAGFVLSLTFTYGGYLTSFPVQQVTILQVSAWLPWVMWMLSQALSLQPKPQPGRSRLSALGWTGLFFALAILAGHPQTALYIFYLTLAYSLFMVLAWWAEAGQWVVISMRSEEKSGSVNQSSESTTKMSHFLRNDKAQNSGFNLTMLTPLLLWAVSVGLGFLIAAAQLWPTLEFISHSLRADLSFSAVSQGLPLSELVSILYPGYFGGSPQYVGILPLVLIAVTLILPPSAARRQIYFWLGVVFVSLLLAFGANTFLYPLFYLLTPGFAAVRQQERVYFLYSFAAAVLASYGAIRLALPLNAADKARWQRFRHRLGQVSIGALALTGLFIYGATAANERGDEVNLLAGVLRHHVFGLLLLAGVWFLLLGRSRHLWRRGWGASLIVGWLIFNLFSINWRYNLAERPDPAPFTPIETNLFLLEHVNQQPQPVRINSGGFLNGGNNAASVLGLEDVTGNAPLQLAKVAAFAEQIPSWRFWQLMNVLYVVDERDIDGPGLARRYEASGLSVYEIGDPFPRARLLHNAIFSDDRSVLAQESTDLKTTALLPPQVTLPLSVPTMPSTATIINMEPGHIVINTESSTAGLLVLSNIDYPGWQATLDGNPVEIYSTNGIFQGVAIPAGTHQVTLEFRPNTFWRGVWLSGLGLVLTLILIRASRNQKGMNQE